MASLTARDWTVAAAQRLATDGVDQVRVEPLAKALGVSKGSFYWHFTDRAALLQSVLDAWEVEGTERIIDSVDATAAVPEERLRTLIERTFGQPQHDGHELGIRAWARRDPAVRAAVARVDKRRVGYIASLLTDAGAEPRVAVDRAEVLYRTLIGEFVLRSHGHPGLGGATLESLATLALTDVGASG